MTSSKVSRDHITQRNKERRAKRLAAFLLSSRCLKRQENAKLRKEQKRLRKINSPSYKPGSNIMEDREKGELSIRLHSTGEVFHGLTVDSVEDSKRDTSTLPKEHQHGAKGSVKEPGRICFITPAGKKWLMNFSEFSFLIKAK
jgi:hypothetical protein